jgi:uncharacterized membrane protein
MNEANHDVSYRPLIRAGVFLGIGMGGFLDGILFHQILQTHAMLTGRIAKMSIANIEVNMFWDGMFHVLTWTMTAIGVALLWRAGKRTDVPWSAKSFVGSLSLGWGLFNFVEGVIDHHILNLHHVVEALGLSVYDYAFLASGVVLILAGWFAMHTDRKREPVFHPVPKPVHEVA